ncbi:MAG: ATP-binding cassette domain-containing protein [Proteobacteria bacterium]|jgi:ATP-binding cassette subfamily F protein 3|nr:ATP-binding cassette domain-containing protein [Pseudomonadota bacterium]
MIRIAGLTLARGDRVLLRDADLAVHAGHKVGIVGSNGCGKSSLFALLRGELVLDAGSVELPPRWTLASVAQETPAVEIPAIEFVQDGDAELRALERELALAEHDHVRAGDGAGPHTAPDPAHVAELHSRFEAIGGYRARARAATLLAGLGFDEAAQARPVATFSGGWRMRLNLARALMCRSDLLLLDEPTNHLDLDAVLWLEEWLRRYPGTLLLITHDRDFLDAVAGTIVHFDAGKLVSYRGNYAQFERERAERLALLQANRAKQQREIAHLRAYIDRFRAKATRARQAQSRIRTLERMELIAPAHVDSPFEFAFAPTAVHARQLVRLEAASLGYAGAPPVLAGIDWAVLAGARIGLLGANGAGKSTLLKSLAGTLPLIAGTRHAAQALRLGYFAQHQVEQLRSDQSPLWHLRRLEAETREQELRDYLGGFDFRGDQATEPVAPLSGGEKARLALALIVRERPNLLLLDEPTNHLDLEMREALTEALQDYDGALIVVAHDRHLLRATADELWWIADGTLAPFDGDLDDYRAQVLARGRRRATEGAAENPGGEREGGERADDATGGERGDRRAQRRAEALVRQQRSDRRKPLLARQSVIEREMEALEGEKRELERWLASPAAYADDEKARLVAALERQGELTFSLARLETEWLELAEAL